MRKFNDVRNAAAALALAGALLAPALVHADKPSATIKLNGGQVAFVAGVSWGGGTLYYKHHKYPLQVSGIQVGAIGASHYNIEGDVYHLHNVKDIEGTFGAVQASATAGEGAGSIDMSNGQGVEIVAHSTSSGLNLTLAPSGVQIRLK
ncbi:MAG: hypothetical protein ACHP84_06420 [Caulobacterales bacterium]|jgi:hypothetical protein